MSYTPVQERSRHFGCAPVHVDWCEAPLIGQHGMTCQRRKGHDGPHECLAAWPPCLSCWGLDEHLAGCLMPDTTTPRSVVVQWLGVSTNTTEPQDAGT